MKGPILTQAHQGYKVHLELSTAINQRIDFTGQKLYGVSLTPQLNSKQNNKQHNAVAVAFAVVMNFKSGIILKWNQNYIIILKSATSS